MFFVLSKVFLIFIFPLTWIVLLLSLSVFSKNPSYRRKSLKAALILLVLFSNPFLLNLFARAWDVRSETLPHKPYSCAIILGGFSSVDAAGKGFFNGASDRFIQAIKLRLTGRASNLLICGGSPLVLSRGKLKESDFVLQELKKLKLADSTIMIENISRNTVENALFSKRILDKRKLAGPYILVTSAFHMRRSLYIFEKAGVKVVPYSCNYIAGVEEATISDLFPDAKTLNFWNIYIKEVIGYGVYYLKTEF